MIYIGPRSLAGPGDGDLIYDWRADECSMYYQQTPGPAYYYAPMGRIDGVLVLKRKITSSSAAKLVSVNEGGRYASPTGSPVDEPGPFAATRRASRRSHGARIVKSIQAAQDAIIRHTAKVLMSGSIARCRRHCFEPPHIALSQCGE